MIAFLSLVRGVTTAPSKQTRLTRACVRDWQLLVGLYQDSSKVSRY